MDVLIVTAIVGLAAGWLIRTFYRKWKKVGDDSTCTACSSCTACCPMMKEKL